VKLKIRGLVFNYASIPVLNDVTLELGESEVLVCVGPNGAGKTTLLRCIDGLLKPERGSIFLDGKEIKEMTMMEIARRVGYVPQSASRAFPTTVFNTVLIGRRPHIRWRGSERDIKAVVEVLKLMGIENLAMRDVNELSGGQLQKVLIARVLAQEADILLMDEPTSNLDIKHQFEVMDIIKDIVRSRGISVIMAIHDLNLAARYADRIIIMNNGKIFDAGDATKVLTPKNIKRVYDVSAEVVYIHNMPVIVPIKRGE